MALVILQTKAHCPPFPFVQQIGKAFTYGTKRINNCAFWGRTYALYKKDIASWAVEEKEDERCVKQCTESALKDPKLIKRVRSTFMKKVPGFNRTVENMRKADLKKLSDKEMYKMWKTFCDEYFDIYIWSEPIPFFTKDSIAEHLLGYLERKIDASKARQYLNILASPTEISFVKREERDMLKIAARLKKEPGNVKLKKDLLDRHEKRWSWIPYDYGVMLWGKRHFQKELDEMLKNRDPDSELKKIDDYFSNLKREQKRIIKELGIDKRHQDLFEDVRICAFIMDYKKEMFSKSHVAVRPLLQETAKRLGLTFHTVQYIMMDELKAGLVDGRKLDSKRISARERLSYLEYRGKSVRMWEGETAEMKIKDMLKRIKKEGKEIKGAPASPGVYKGRVRIILDSRKIGRLKKGEILVTNMTSPDYTVGMKKAGAIVTNEGGITCHAAVISRERGIPCIIGTKNASKMLKDGDIVEVDADKGIVRKIR